MTRPHVPIRRVGWVIFKLVLMGWAATMLAFPPEVLNNALASEAILVTWTSMTLLGGAGSITGLVLQGIPKHRSLGVVVEMASLALLAVGPLVYFLAQVSLVVTLWPATDRIALAVFALAMVCAVLARMAEVYPRWHKEGK